MCLSTAKQRSHLEEGNLKGCQSHRNLHFQLYKRIILLKYYFSIYNKCLIAWCFHVVPIYRKHNNVIEHIPPEKEMLQTIHKEQFQDEYFFQTL